MYGDLLTYLSSRLQSLFGKRDTLGFFETKWESLDFFYGLGRDFYINPLATLIHHRNRTLIMKPKGNKYKIKNAVIDSVSPYVREMIGLN